jgi:cysteine-rich repeat protein
MRLETLKKEATVVISLSLVAIFAGNSFAQDGLTAKDLACRAGLESVNASYQKKSTSTRQRCMRRIFAGQTAASVDCIEGQGDSKTAERLQDLDDRVSARIPRKCTGANLEALGFPGVCQDTVSPPGSFDVNDLSRCVVDENDEIVAEMLVLEYPPETFLPSRYVKCINGVGRKANGMVASAVAARGDCSVRDERDPFFNLDCRQEMIPYGPGTADERTNDRVVNSYVTLLGGMPRNCAAVNLDLLDYTDDCVDETGGAFTAFDLKLCLFDSHRGLIDDVVDISFPPGPACGNGIVEGEEQCDDGNNVDTDACTSECRDAFCGDGIVWEGEEDCDDGNDDDTDGCSSTCMEASCGDGIVQGGEECDDGNNVNTDGCLNNCSAAACGDGVLCGSLTDCTTGPTGGAEDCDDGGRVSGDGCSDVCGIEFCGDGVVNNNTEECDDGAENGTGPNQCRAGACTLPVCGDEIVDNAPEFGETCDPPDGVLCDDNCMLLSCGNGVLDDGEECDDGEGNSDTTPDACRTDCTSPGCGDTIVDTGEQCDDGNSNPNDDCTDTCQNNVCGDGILNDGVEQCDDGAGNSDTTPDACRTDCRVPGCGDGVADSTEECDDGNTSDEDPCTNECKNNVCGDGLLNAGVEDCDDGASNSDTQPDACRTTCVLAACGDDVIDTGEQCDGTSNEPCADLGGGCGAACTCANECPAVGELTVMAGAGEECTSDDQCELGVCDPILGRCRSATRLDTGLTGIAHGADVTDGVTVRGFLECGSSFPCGECTVEGLDPSPGYCRCANDNRQICDEKFAPDQDDCGGEMCNCYFGPPLSLSSGNTPACVVNRFREDISGTADVDAGAGAVTASLGSIVYLAQNTTAPCPACLGDDILADGVRNGTCGPGLNEGQSCDAIGIHRTFPSPGGGGYSLDCFPNPDTNVSGSEGLLIDLEQQTSRVELGVTGDIDCSAGPFQNFCFCALCSGDTSVPCNSDADCEEVGAGECSSFGGDRAPLVNNKCTPVTGEFPTNDLCQPVDEEGLFGECTIGPDDLYCDGVTRANGLGFVQCLSDADCAEGAIGFPAGTCSLTERRRCFLDPIVGVGKPDPQYPTGAATFCIAKVASSPAINSVAGLPGPGRIVNQAKSALFCASDLTVQYQPGVGGCP